MIAARTGTDGTVGAGITTRNKVTSPLSLAPVHPRFLPE